MSSRWSDALRHALPLRLGLWYAALFAVSATALLLFTYALLGRALAAQDHDVLASMLSRYALEYQRGGLGGLQRLIEADAGEGRHERLLVRVVSGPAEVIYSSQPPDWRAVDLASVEALRRGSAWMLQSSPIDGSLLEIGTADLPNGVRVQVGRTSHVRDELLAHFRARAVQVGLLLAIIAVAGGVLIAYVGLAPVRALDATTREILATRRFDARVATRGTRDPLDQLGAGINEMLARIQGLVAGMRGALDNVAHDLRTPLTRFRNVAEAALTSGDQAAVRDGLGQALEEADRVGATLTALMDISEAETGTMQLTLAPVDVGAVVAEAIALYADEAEDAGLTLIAGVPPATRVRADHTRLRQVVANLVENAVKYTPPGGRVEITAATHGNVVVLEVRDTGIGIAAADLPLIWDRLYRADSSRSARGLGLGLSLVKAVVEAHRGQVAVRSTPGEGSTFTVTLPAADVA
ncbi:MAG: sensor histidine kinase [Dehalococcoidia bacterium]